MHQPADFNCQERMRPVKLICLSLLILGCRKNDILHIDCTQKTNQRVLVEKIMEGSYNWAYSIIRYQIGGNFTETPASTGFRYRYLFKRNGLVEFYQNDTLQWAANYRLDLESAVTRYPSDSATVIIITDPQTGQRREFFRPYLCNDSAYFYNPYSSIYFKRYFKRN